MASVQDRLKLKRISYDTWSTREQLCLASSVLKSGDQNWISVSRSLKPFAEKEALRPPDWFSQKSCAIQYAHLLENADTPKRKKRESGETTGESIVKRLTQERIAELGQILAFQRDEYQQLKAEVNLLKSGSVSEEKMQKMWLAIEQEEREQEQKSRAHSAWLAKRQQKQDAPAPLAISPANQRKPGEAVAESQELNDSTATEEEDKKNRGGRSPLLTSLLKSPSPTTQIQTPTTSAQVSSPTIASLLGSSPKVPTPQLTQRVSPQLHQLVSISIADTTIERPSVSAPTLSRLLELPANAQRGPLPNLQTTIANIPQQNIVTDIEIQSRSTNQITTINEVQVTQTPAINTSSNISNQESMVQIIDHIDDVIRKDIMADVIDKDEINEIIGDIEELIKEEITASPQTLDTSTTASVVSSLSLPLAPEIVTERQQPRDVDEPVSLSNSPQSDIAIEDIDSSTSNIAEIIGTVAIEPAEAKIIVTETRPNTLIVKDNSKVEESVSNETVTSDEKLEPITEDKDENDKDNSPVKEKEAIVEQENDEEKEKSPETVHVDSKQDTEVPSVIKESTVDIVEEVQSEEEEEDEEEEEEEEEEVEVEAETETETVVPVKEITNDNIDIQESCEEIEEKEDMEIDQLELHLAKITGDEDAPVGAEVASVSSETTNDAPSAEDTEKSQDISFILEDDESSHSSEDREKKKIAIESSIIENTMESPDDLEPIKAEVSTTPKVEPNVEVTDDASTVKQEESVETVTETIIDEVMKEDTKDTTEDTEASASEKIPPKEEDQKQSSITQDTSATTILEEIENTKEEPEEELKVEAEIEDTISKENEQLPATLPEKSNAQKMEEESKAIPEIITPPVKEEPKKADKEIKKEKAEPKEVEKVESIIKKEVTESAGSAGDDVGDLDEEESGLSKLSGGRAMKTYSKKQTLAVDSEPENEGSGEGADYRAWKKAVMLVYNRLATHKYASVFLRPITEDQAPGYHSVIFRPMDLSTIKKNIDNGTIRSTMHFQRDVMLMFQNAIIYNKHDTFVYKMAVSMQEECLQHMQILVQVTGEGPFRRETRTAASSSSEASESSVKRKRSHITPSPHDTDSPRTKKRRKSEND
ncbi:bromodomain-containing protein 8 [Cephus cinctus]|uniref:Bromodomain-containing protein 8 n=1 Tax=Cephus cinctus TaxID=211228 RepID=A0AAJ7BGG1_CEPCN|nr:bromodomain-containing protein 8 [Cephus cinctus]